MVRESESIGLPPVTVCFVIMNCVHEGIQLWPANRDGWDQGSGNRNSLDIQVSVMNGAIVGDLIRLAVRKWTDVTC